MELVHLPSVEGTWGRLNRGAPFFVLKGGTLLARYVDIGRETKDLDFTIQRLSNEISALQKTFNIVRVEIEDGFVFMNPVVAPLEYFHMEYPGAHVKIDVRFGKAKFPLFIDLGFGDLVQVREKELLLLSNSKGPLFEPSMLGEASTKKIAVNRDAQGFDENKNMAKIGGKIARNARLELELESGKVVISKENYLGRLTSGSNDEFEG
jgi:hypothetical protein